MFPALHHCPPAESQPGPESPRITVTIHEHRDARAHDDAVTVMVTPWLASVSQAECRMTLPRGTVWLRVA